MDAEQKCCVSWFATAREVDTKNLGTAEGEEDDMLILVPDSVHSSRPILPNS